MEPRARRRRDVNTAVFIMRTRVNRTRLSNAINKLFTIRFLCLFFFFFPTLMIVGTRRAFRCRRRRRHTSVFVFVRANYVETSGCRVTTMFQRWPVSARRVRLSYVWFSSCYYVNNFLFTFVSRVTECPRANRANGVLDASRRVHPVVRYPIPNRTRLFLVSTSE